MLILSTGGKGTGVEAEGSNFPFVQPGPDIQGLLADLWLSHEYRDVALPLRVYHMVGFQQAFDGQPSDAAITIVDSKGAVIFDSPANTHETYYWKDWSPRLRIHEWLLGTSAVCRVVQHTAVPEPRASWPNDIFPINGVLDERTSELLPARLTKLSVPSGIVITDKATFINGWNVNIAAAPYREPLRNTTALTFSADPGKGKGREPGCQDITPILRKINGVGPDPRGNFSLAVTNCYYARTPLIIDANGLAKPAYLVDPLQPQLVLGNDCDPCCDCDAYANVQKAILNVEADLRAAAKLAEATRDEFTAAKERWNAQKDCRDSQAVSITAATAARLYADINVLICNVTQHCMVDVTVNIATTSQPQGSWSVVSGTTFISQAGQTAMVPYQLVGPQMGPGGPTLTAHIGAINPMASGRIKLRLVWTHVMPAGTMLTIAATAALTDATNTAFPQTATYTTLMT